MTSQQSNYSLFICCQHTLLSQLLSPNITYGQAKVPIDYLIPIECNTLIVI